MLPSRLLAKTRTSPSCLARQRTPYITRWASSLQSDQTNARIWDRYAQAYSQKPIKDEAAYHYKLQKTQDYLKPHMQVLEIGCGTGGTAIHHSNYVQHILATDLSAKMLDIARAKAKDAGVLNVEFRQASVDDLLLEETNKERYHVVLGMSILHLLFNRDEVMRQVHDEWLVPSGLFITSTACFGDLPFLQQYYIKAVFGMGQLVGFLPHLNFMTKQDLRQSFVNAGFDIEYEWQPHKDPKAAVFIIGQKK